MKNVKTKIISSLAVVAASIVIAVQVFSVNASAKAVTSNLKAERVELEWMRSSEDSSDAYLRPIVTGTDAFTYEDVMNNTSLRYFESASAQAQANAKALNGNENVYNSADQLVGQQYVWDNGSYFSLYLDQNGDVDFDWASWSHLGENGHLRSFAGVYSLRRFTSYFDLNEDLLDQLDLAVLAPEDANGNMSYLFPINDTIFVFVNGQLAYWGGTDIKEGDNQYGALIRSSFMGKDGVPVTNGVNGELKDVYPHTDGWCIDLDAYKDETNIRRLLTAGENRIDIIADDFYEGGGMNKLQLFVEYQEIEEKVEVSGLNWNNGNTSNKNGANGAGLIQFTVDGITLKNNKNYVTPENFDAAIAKTVLGKKDNTMIYTVLERTVDKNGVYVKVYDTKVAFYQNGAWKVYAGTITVDNPGGNDNNQKLDFYRVQ